MGAILAGAAIAAVGAGVSAYGTSQNASATRDQAKFNAYLENKFGKKWNVNAEELEKQKLDKLYDVGNIFERFEGAGAFGDTNTLDNLRKAQSDFAALGAGDFTGFESQLRSIMQDNLVTTVGSGAPVGTYTNISADSVMNLRRQGLGEASAVTGLLSGLSNELLGIEFGVMDRSFEQRYNIDRGRLSGITGNSMAAAQTAGVGTQAIGGAVQSIGGSIANYGLMNRGNQTMNAPKGVPLYENGSPMPGWQVGSDGYYMQAPYGYNQSPVGTPGRPYSGGVNLNSTGGWGDESADLPSIDPYGNVVDGGVLPSRGYGVPQVQLGWDGYNQQPAGSLGYGYGPNTASLFSVGASIAGQ